VTLGAWESGINKVKRRWSLDKADHIWSWWYCETILLKGSRNVQESKNLGVNSSSNQRVVEARWAKDKWRDWKSVRIFLGICLNFDAKYQMKTNWHWTLHSTCS